MHKTLAEAKTWLEQWQAESLPSPPPHLEVAIFPPSLILQACASLSDPARLSWGAQNIHWENQGAWTGEIAATMVRDAGAAWALIGHSERRQHFSEQDHQTGAKLRAAWAARLQPILCVGETRAQREAKMTDQVITAQLNLALSEAGIGAVAALPGRLVVAYEPVWAIGTGLVATPEMAQDAHQVLRDSLVARLGQEEASRVHLLYGGSVKPDNAAELARQSQIDGFLVGGASLEAKTFAAIGRALAQAD
jgi:triosephosphate isomerase